VDIQLHIFASPASDSGDHFVVYSLERRLCLSQNRTLWRKYLSLMVKAKVAQRYNAVWGVDVYIHVFLTSAIAGGK
jgi:hypothetical protein